MLKEFKIKDRGDIQIEHEGEWISPYQLKPQGIDKHLGHPFGFGYSHFDTYEDEMIFLRFPFYLKRSWMHRFPLAYKRWQWLRSFPIK